MTCEALSALVTAIARIGDDALDESLLSRLPGFPVARSMPSDLLPELYRDRKPELFESAQQVSAVLTQPPTEIAAALELSVGSVGTTLARARRRLAETYEALQKGDTRRAAGGQGAEHDR